MITAKEGITIDKGISIDDCVFRGDTELIISGITDHKGIAARFTEHLRTVVRSSPQAIFTTKYYSAFSTITNDKNNYAFMIFSIKKSLPCIAIEGDRPEFSVGITAKGLYESFAKKLTGQQ